MSTSWHVCPGPADESPEAVTEIGMRNDRATG
ncbi:hypothetical protein SYYSPA8_02070 [Streptomyces yaizuensis]|uniref:Uncharacterized protein n=1 Tax=Streptomyces yaizuensis TaxID=2989713 RepID=A0ABQ5NRN4_9ACTN|nr:hypothetical protein SYYSPA8_02070 [Streptomyces sp. YSPA8]